MHTGGVDRWKRRGTQEMVAHKGCSRLRYPLERTVSLCESGEVRKSDRRDCREISTGGKLRWKSRVHASASSTLCRFLIEAEWNCHGGYTYTFSKDRKKINKYIERFSLRRSIFCLLTQQLYKLKAVRKWTNEFNMYNFYKFWYLWFLNKPV